MLRQEFKKMLLEEDGATVVFMPMMVILFMLMFTMMINVMHLSMSKRKVQFMADSATRAACTAVKQSYAIKELPGSGKDSYHVYIELEPAQADSNAQKILDAYAPDVPSYSITSKSLNPWYSSATGNYYPSPLWSSSRQQYYYKLVSRKRQLQNGVYQMELVGNLKTTGGQLLGLPKELKIQTFSQSRASGQVTNR